MKLVHWPFMGGLLHLVQRGGDWAGHQPAQAPPRCAKCNSPPINGQYQSLYCCIILRPDSIFRLWRSIKHLLTYLLTYLLTNGPLLCGFTVGIKG